MGRLHPATANYAGHRQPGRQAGLAVAVALLLVPGGPPAAAVVHAPMPTERLGRRVIRRALVAGRRRRRGRRQNFGRLGCGFARFDLRGSHRLRGGRTALRGPRCCIPGLSDGPGRINFAHPLSLVPATAAKSGAAKSGAAESGAVKSGAAKSGAAKSGAAKSAAAARHRAQDGLCCIARRRSVFRVLITSSGISLGQALAHSPILVQPPNPS